MHYTHTHTRAHTFSVQIQKNSKRFSSDVTWLALHSEKQYSMSVYVQCSVHGSLSFGFVFLFKAFNSARDRNAWRSICSLRPRRAHTQTPKHAHSRQIQTENSFAQVWHRIVCRLTPSAKTTLIHLVHISSPSSNATQTRRSKESTKTIYSHAAKSTPPSRVSASGRDNVTDRMNRKKYIVYWRPTLTNSKTEMPSIDETKRLRLTCNTKPPKTHPK